ncbi:MAG: hypothetical protein ACRC2R_22930 [Xenococcaceae cyanobacterium]
MVCVWDFIYLDREQAELNYQNTLFTGHCVNPSAQCAAIKKLERDAKLWSIAARYLETDPILHIVKFITDKLIFEFVVFSFNI